MAVPALPLHSPRARRLTLLVILVVAALVRLAAILLIEVDPRAHWGYDMTWYVPLLPVLSLMAAAEIVSWTGGRLQARV